MLLTWVYAPDARAQACCAGGGAYQPARLKLHEDYLIGISFKGSDQLGYADQFGVYHADAAGTGEQDFEEDVLATARVFERGQIGLTLPFPETRRYVPNITDFGGGLGDISVSARWDFLYADESAHLPGIAVLGGFTFPSGVAPEASTSILGASATGQGAYQGSLGLALERTFSKHLVLVATGLVTQAFERHVAQTESELGTLFSGLVAAGWVFPTEAALALTLTYSDSLNDSINHQTQADSGRQVNTLGIAGGLPLSDEWRLQGTVFWDLPVLGRNRIDGLGGSFTVIRAFL